MHAIKLQFVSIPRQRDSIKLLYTSFVCIILRIKESLKIPLSTKILCKDKPISIVFLISIMVLINIVFNFIDEMGGGGLIVEVQTRPEAEFVILRLAPDT